MHKRKTVYFITYTFQVLTDHQLFDVLNTYRYNSLHKFGLTYYLIDNSLKNHIRPDRLFSLDRHNFSYDSRFTPSNIKMIPIKDVSRTHVKTVKESLIKICCFISI